MGDDWACDGCDFVNSGFLQFCELCSAPRVATEEGPGPSGTSNDVIVLSDDDDDDNERLTGGNCDVVNLTDDNMPEQAARTQRAGRSCTALQPLQEASRRQQTDVTIIYDDDDDCLLMPPPQRNGPPQTFPAPSSSRDSSSERFALDACNCTHNASALATQIGPVLSRAITLTHPPGPQPQQPTQSAGAGPTKRTLSQGPTTGVTHSAQAASAPTATLYDLTAPLVCPAALCGTWISSRDVRLLLGPHGTHVLYHAMFVALRQEAKSVKALQLAVAGGSATGGAGAAVPAVPSAVPAAETKDATVGGRRGSGRRHRPRRGAHGQGTQANDEATSAATSAPAAADGNGASPAPISPPAPPPQLPPLEPSCPSCRFRMMSTAALAQCEHTHTHPQQQVLQAQQQHPQLEVQLPLKQPARGKRRRFSDPGDAGAAAAGPSAAAAAASGARPGGPPCAPCLHSEQLEHALRILAAHGSAAAPGGGGGDAIGMLAAREGGDHDDMSKRLCGRVLQLVGPRCCFVCLACAEVLEEGAVLPQRARQDMQRKAQVASEALQLLRRLRAVLLSVQEEEEGKEGTKAPAAPTGAVQGTGDRSGANSRTAAGPSRKRGRSNTGASMGGGYGGEYGSSKAWAKGVGYGDGDWGGGGGSSTVDVEARRKAQERQRQADLEVRNCLTALLDLLSSCRTSGSGAAAGSGGGGGGGGPVLSSPPPVLLAALQYGGLPYVLRLLLQNDSLLDMGQRQELYGVVLSVVRRCLSSMSLLELLMVPAADPRDISPASPTITTDPPLCTVFESLARQCSVFKRSAQELADGAEEEDIAALGLALELGAVAEEVAAGSLMWRQRLGSAQGILKDLIQLPAAPTAAPTATATAATGMPCGSSAGTSVARRLNQRHHGGGATSGDLAVNPSGSGGGVAAATGAVTSSAGAAAAAAGGAGLSTAAGTDSTRRSQYMSSMRALQFREVNLMDDHYFRRDVSESARSAAGGEVMRQRLKRITGEISGLSTGLPLEWDAAAFVAVDENRVDVLRALLIPASDTPYANGPFIFDIYLPPNYPATPPRVQFLTTGGGRVRFNPNLYAEGKVCLSLLGTWSGPSWNPAMSTVLQVLVSIHSMILVNDPYYNEPGWESQAGTAAGRQAASDYANTQCYNTLAFSILPALQMIVKGHKSLAGGNVFSDVLRTHFKLKAPELLAQCDTWMAGIAAAARRPPVTGPRTFTFSSAPGLTSSMPGVPLSGGAPSMPTESSQEQVKRYTESVVPQIKELLRML